MFTRILISLIVGIFIFFVIIGLLSDEGKKGFEQGKQDAKEVVEPQTQSFSESELSETTIRSEIGTLKGSLRALKADDLTKVEIIDYAGTEAVSDDKIVFLTYKPKSTWDEKDAVKTAADTTVAVSQRLFTHSKVGFVRVWIEGDFTDQYGKSSSEPAVKFGLSKDTANKIEWDKFKDLVFVDYTKLSNIADEKYIHPAIGKAL